MVLLNTVMCCRSEIHLLSEKRTILYISDPYSSWNWSILMSHITCWGAEPLQNYSSLHENESFVISSRDDTGPSSGSRQFIMVTSPNWYHLSSFPTGILYNYWRLGHYLSSCFFLFKTWYSSIVIYPTRATCNSHWIALPNDVWLGVKIIHFSVFKFLMNSQLGNRRLSGRMKDNIQMNQCYTHWQFNSKTRHLLHKGM
jgi:hypothetical protein